MLSVTGRSVRREEPLLLAMMQLWRPLSADCYHSNALQGSQSSATGSRDTSYSQLKHYFISVCNCTHKVVYTKSELKMSPRHNWRLWMQEIHCQNVRVQIMVCLNVLSSLKGMTAGVNFCIRYHHFLLQIFPCDWFWLKKASC